MRTITYTRALLLLVGLLLLAVLLPVPGPLVDLLLLGNGVLAAVLLAQAARAEGLAALPRFPELMLVTLLLRTGANLAAVRRLLREGDAGSVADAALQVLAAGDARVGAVLLLLLFAAQYLLLARGGERVAEVAARFRLESMPGQQAAIEADLRSGALSPAEARGQRAALLSEAQAFGTMDGALRFVRGDVVGALLALALALLGGAFAQSGAGVPLGPALAGSAEQAVALGLCTQVPAVLTAVAASLLLARRPRPAALPELQALPRGGDLGLDEVQGLLEGLRRERPVLVREAVPKAVTLPVLAAVLRGLAAEGMAPLPLREVLEVLVALKQPAEEPALLTEQVRELLGEVLVRGHLRGGALPALVLSVELEQALQESLSGAAGREVLALEPELQAELAEAVLQGRKEDPQAVLLCHGVVRRHLRALLLAALPGAPPPVLAYSELPAQLALLVRGRITPGGYVPA